MSSARAKLSQKICHTRNEQAVSPWLGWLLNQSLGSGGDSLLFAAEIIEIRRTIDGLASRLEQARAAADLPRQQAVVADLEQQVERSDLWDEPQQAQELMSRLTDAKQLLAQFDTFDLKVSLERVTESRLDAPNKLGA